MSKRTMREDWGTPASIFDPLDREFRFTLDAAADSVNFKVPKYYGHDSMCAVDGLAADWSGEIVWLNPPYGHTNLHAWMGKAYRESLNGATVVCLVPAYPGQVWWHDFVWHKASEIRWIKGKVKFEGADSCATFPSCIVIYRSPRPAVVPPTPPVTRFEVIDHRSPSGTIDSMDRGRVYVAQPCKIELSYQDKGATLKVFVEDPAVVEAAALRTCKNCGMQDTKGSHGMNSECLTKPGSWFEAATPPSDTGAV